MSIEFMVKKDELLIRARVLLQTVQEIHGYPQIEQWLKEYMEMAREIMEK